MVSPPRGDLKDEAIEINEIQGDDADEEPQPSRKGALRQAWKGKEMEREGKQKKIHKRKQIKSMSDGKKNIKRLDETLKMKVT